MSGAHSASREIRAGGIGEQSYCQVPAWLLCSEPMGQQVSCKWRGLTTATDPTPDYQAAAAPNIPLDSRCGSCPPSFITKLFGPNHTFWDSCCSVFSAFHSLRYLEKWGRFSTVAMAPDSVSPSSPPLLVPRVASFLGGSLLTSYIFFLLLRTWEDLGKHLVNKWSMNSLNTIDITNRV